MKPIRRQASEILGVLIPEDKWDETFRELGKEGKITQREMIEMLLVVFKRLEEHETEE